MAPGSTPTCASVTTPRPNDSATIASREPKIRSSTSQEAQVSINKNKSPLKKAKATPTPTEPAAAKKSQAAPKKAAAGKLATTTKSTAKAAAGKKMPAASSKANAGDVGGGVGAGNGVSKSTPAKRGEPAKKSEKTSWNGILMRNIYAGYNKKAPENKGVLFRPTARADDDFERLNGGKSRKDLEKAREHATSFSKKKAEVEVVKVFRVMDLPEELRALVWRYAVVLPKGFIWPEEKFGHEQPDLAMTCRQVRAEVLPIFYGENFFAINLKQSPSKAKKHRKGISTIKTWGEALNGTAEQPSWFSYIRRWVLSYPGPGFSIVSMNNGQVIKDDIGFMISINFSKRQHDGIFWDASIECHRDALCLQESHEQYGICKVQTVPAKLNDAVIAVTEAAKDKCLTVDMIYGMTEEIERNLVVARDLRCEDLSI